MRNYRKTKKVVFDPYTEKKEDFDTFAIGDKEDKTHTGYLLFAINMFNN